jgi:polar amino acid transport system permease protein
LLANGSLSVSYDFDFSVLLKYPALLLNGLMGTLEIFALSTVCAVVIGLCVAVARVSKSRLAASLSVIYVEVIRNTPILAQLFWWYYVFPLFVPIDQSAFSVTVLAISVHIGAYLSEIFRTAIQSIHVSQSESAASLGLSKWQILRRIVLPQAVLRVIPPLLTYVVIILKLTALTSLIGGQDLLYAINQINQISLRSIELYTFVALVYIAIAAPVTMGVSRIQSKIRLKWGL